MANTSRSSRATIDHDEIRRWAEERGGHPAAVRRTRGKRGQGNVGLLRIDFPGFSKRPSLEEISWDEFFDQFEESDLAFLYQDKTTAGRTSRFNKLVDRETAEIELPRRKMRGERRPRALRKAKAPRRRISASRKRNS